MCPQSENKPYLYSVSSSTAGARGVTTFLGLSGHGPTSAGAVTGIPADAAAMVMGAGVSGVTFAAHEGEAELLPVGRDHGVFAVRPFGKGCRDAS